VLVQILFICNPFNPRLRDKAIKKKILYEIT